MTFLNRLLFILILFFQVWISPQLFAEVSYSLEETLPPNVTISGVVHPDNDNVYNGTYDALLEFFNEDASVPTVSIKQSVNFYQNYFRINIDLRETLFPMFRFRKKMYVRLTVDDVNITLPFASVPMSIKSGLATTANQMIDNNVFSIDYDLQRIGIGTSVPSSTVHVVGTANATQFFVGDGSQLTNLKHGGGDNYNFLNQKMVSLWL